MNIIDNDLKPVIIRIEDLNIQFVSNQIIFPKWQREDKWPIKFKQDLIISILNKRMIPMIFFGTWGLPMGPPKAAPLTVIVGEPIEVPHSENPTEEELQKYHQIYIDETIKLYNDHKADYGMENIPLVVE